MDKIFHDIENSFLERWQDSSFDSELWRSLINAFPTHLDRYSDGFPSSRLSSDSGDLGFSILWIVQSAIITPFLEHIDYFTNNERLNSKDLSPGALAHSEDPQNPFTFTEEKNSYILNGSKKYITAGKDCKYILLTARKPGDEKITSLFYLPAEILPKNSLSPKLMNSLKTTSHSSLQLTDFSIDRKYLLKIEESELRRLLKKSGIIERSLIFESVLSHLVYINTIIKKHNGDTVLNSTNIKTAITSQTKIAIRQINELKNNSRITTDNSNLSILMGELSKLRNHIEPIKESIPDEIKSRYDDLSFLNKLR